MTSQKLYDALQLMVDLDAQLSLQASLNQIRDNLVNLANQPATRDFQTNLTSAMATFSDGVKKLRTEVTPSEFGTIAELGGAEFFDPSIADRIRDSIEHNAMTPMVARDFVQDIATRRAAFLKTVNATLDGLKSLLSTQPPREELAPGEAAFTIPRELFDNQLGKFSKELSFISSMTEHMSEAVTGEIQPVKLEYLASSVPIVAIGAGLGMLTLLGSVINSYLDAWKKVEEIREIREKLKAVGASGAASKEMDERIVSTVDEVVEESTALALSSYKGDSGRRNELEIHLRMDLHRLFGQIERGLTVEIRTNEPINADKSTAAELAALSDLAKNLVFPAAAKTPMLLTSSEILEGDVSSKKATTTKTTKKASTKAQPVAGSKEDE
jgi:hypothetical protein